MTRGRAGTGTPTVVLPHVRISFGGTIGVPAVEVWENTINYTGATDALTADIMAAGASLPDQMAQLKIDIVRWFSSIDTAVNGAGASLISNSVALDYIKLNLVGPNNRYTNQPNTLQFAGIQAQGPQPSDGPPMPWQSTYGITLRVVNRRTGRGSKGRVFPPLAGCSPPVGSPYIDARLADAMTHSFATLLGDINTHLFSSNGFVHPAADPGVGNCIVVSPVPHKGPNIGAAALNSVITKVEINRVADVMTSRVNRVPRKTDGDLAVPVLTNPPAA
jgi:hypothetical protein